MEITKWSYHYLLSNDLRMDIPWYLVSIEFFDAIERYTNINNKLTENIQQHDKKIKQLIIANALNSIEKDIDKYEVSKSLVFEEYNKLDNDTLFLIELEIAYNKIRLKLDYYLLPLIKYSGLNKINKNIYPREGASGYVKYLLKDFILNKYNRNFEFEIRNINKLDSLMLNSNEYKLSTI